MAEVGTVAAVNEACRVNNLRLVMLALQQQMYCDVVLRRRGGAREAS